MVIFHSYVNLPEGNIPVSKKTEIDVYCIDTNHPHKLANTKKRTWYAKTLAVLKPKITQLKYPFPWI